MYRAEKVGQEDHKTTLDTSTGHERKFDDISATIGTSFVSGTYENSTP